MSLSAEVTSQQLKDFIEDNVNTHQHRREVQKKVDDGMDVINSDNSSLVVNNVVDIINNDVVSECLDDAVSLLNSCPIH